MARPRIVVPLHLDSTTPHLSLFIAGGASDLPNFFDVSVPPTATPGAEMTVKSPGGKDITFIVPKGCPPGGVVKLQY